MTCRIGMSNNPHGRINHWKNNGYSRGRILANDLTYDEAQKREEEKAKICGSHCIQEPGGPRVSGRVYSVYRVDG